MMRTTLDIDEDILLAVKELAAAQETTAGKVLSQLARDRLSGQYPRAQEQLKVAEASAAQYGFVPFAAEGRLVTNELIHRIRDEEGI